MKVQNCSADFLEQQMQLAEKFLEEHGAVMQDINRKNREALGQRATYLFDKTYYRIDHAEFDEEEFIIISCADLEKYASIGLMEDVDAIPADAGEAVIDAHIRRALRLNQ